MQLPVQMEVLQLTRKTKYVILITQIPFRKQKFVANCAQFTEMYNINWSKQKSINIVQFIFASLWINTSENCLTVCSCSLSLFVILLNKHFDHTWCYQGQWMRNVAIFSLALAVYLLTMKNVWFNFESKLTQTLFSACWTLQTWSLFLHFSSSASYEL